MLNKAIWFRSFFLNKKGLFPCITVCMALEGVGEAYVLSSTPPQNLRWRSGLKNSPSTSETDPIKFVLPWSRTPRTVKSLEGPWAWVPKRPRRGGVRVKALAVEWAAFCQGGIGKILPTTPVVAWIKTRRFGTVCWEETRNQWLDVRNTGHLRIVSRQALTSPGSSKWRNKIGYKIPAGHVVLWLKNRIRARLWAKPTRWECTRSNLRIEAYFDYT